MSEHCTPENVRIPQSGLGSRGGNRRKPKRPRLSDPRLYWRGPWIWCRVSDPEGSGTKVRLTTKCRDEAAAVAKANEYERAAANPGYRNSQTATFDDAVKDVQAAMVLERKSAATIKAITRRLCTFRRWLKPRGGGEFLINRIDYALVKEYAADRLKEPGRGPDDSTVQHSTLGYDMQALRKLLEEAAALGKFQGSVEKVVKRGAWGERARAVKRYPKIDQAWEIVRAMPRRAAVYLAYICATACRAEEGRRARPAEHLSADGTIVTIDGTKTKHCREHAREIGISPVTAAFLQFALEHAVPGEGFVEMTQGNLRTAILRACAKLKIERYSPNDFRRGWCHWHKDAGFTREFCALQLRHKDETMVRDVYCQEDTSGQSVLERMRAEAGKAGLAVVPVLYARIAATAATGPTVHAAKPENKGNGENTLACG